MAQANRFYKVTKGFNAEVMVAKAVAYTTDATYADFVANAVAGEIGVFNAATLALIDASGVLPAPDAPTLVGHTVGGNLAAATYYYKIVAVNANGTTTGGTEASVTTTGSTSSVNISWDPIAGATGYRIYRGTATDTQAGYIALDGTSYVDSGAALTGSANTPSTNTATTGAAATDGTKIFIAQKRDSGIFKTTPFIKGSTTVKKTAYTAPVKQVTTITFAGTVGTEFKVGDEISVKIIETTPGNEPFPTITYDYTVKAADTVTTIATALKNQMNSLTDLRNVDGGAIVTADNSAGVLTLTAKYFGSSFRVAVPEPGYSIASVVYTTPFKLGSGFYEHVASLEVEGQIYDGVTTQYPKDGFAPGDFGSPTSFATEGVNYDIYHFTPVKTEKSPTPVDTHFHYWNAMLAVPTSGGPSDEIDTIFGF